MNTKTDGISSGLVVVAWSVLNGVHTPLVRLSDAEAIINDLQTLVIAENQRKQQLEAEVALMKVECGESQYCAGCNDAAKIIEEQVERIKVLEAQNKGLQSGLDTDYAQLYQEQVQIGTKQSAALKLARDALQTLGQYYAWLNFGECRTYGEHVPIVDMRLADLICKEALAAIDSLQEGE